ncbi:hypothetical protein [Devosia salina]|uniref:DUF4893 domain-containing protein n=1 Tax=Devosia salina TaxID=2860336 RepID=A0ABX8WCN8_9HYPH|nr:hypothetical protein [Devosia salina]QYO75900.1 hypothetical protein K1X15_14880 [Devosia salina]
MRFSSFYLLMIAICLSSEARASELDVETWRQLWTRCRIAIEQGEKLNTQGLIDLGPSIMRVAPITVEGLDAPLMPGYEVLEQRWQPPGSSFVLVEGEYPDERRSCEVRLAPNVPSVTSVEEAAFVSAFIQERRLLVASGTHEERNPDPIYSTNLGVGSLARSGSGCRIISGLHVETRPGREPFFNSFAAEQSSCLTQP